MFFSNTDFSRAILVCLALLMGSGTSNGKTSETESPSHVSTEWGTLTGQFIFSEERKDPSRIQLREKLEHDNAGRSIVPDNPYYFDKDIYDESLLVGEDGGIANVLVFIRDEHFQVTPKQLANKAKRKVLKIENGRFKPHIFTVRTGEPFSIFNVDPVPLDIRLVANRNSGQQFVLLPNTKRDMKIEKDEPFPIRIQSSLNWWMTAYVFPRNVPHLAITDVNGKFELNRLPVGEWEFQVWHERIGWLTTPDWPKGRFKITISSGSNELGKVVTSLEKSSAN